jgi:hypothetical protein
MARPVVPCPLVVELVARPTHAALMRIPAASSAPESSVVRNDWIVFLEVGERADGPGGLRGKTALDDGPPKRDNSQGLQPSVSGRSLRDDPISSTAPLPEAVCSPPAHAYV